VARFGAAIHVCGRDRAALERAVRGAGLPESELKPIEAGLEESFIYLTALHGELRRAAA
jgi:ABC-2 type transport system ATP-binding protein